MYAHQVIADLRRTSSEHFNNDQVCLFIEKAVKFHISNPKALQALTPEIKSEHNIYWRPPYETCWIDYTENRMKEAFNVGILVQGHMAMLFSDGSGYWSINPTWFEIIRSYLHTPKDLALKDIQKDWAQWEYHTAHWLFATLNCKSIEIKEVNPSMRHIKRRLGKGSVPLFSYKILKIRQPESLGKQSEGLGVALSHNRLHSCRGHLKHYSKAAPLFGKYPGIFWWKPYIRGQNKSGIIMKEYLI